MKHLLLILCLLTISCAHARKTQYENMLKTYIGHKSQTLVEMWGVPTKTFEMPDGGKAFEYLRSKENNIWTRGAFSDAHDTCKTTFFFNPQDKITRYMYEGNDCRLQIKQ